MLLRPCNDKAAVALVVGSIVGNLLSTVVCGNYCHKQDVEVTYVCLFVVPQLFQHALVVLVLSHSASIRSQMDQIIVPLSLFL